MQFTKPKHFFHAAFLCNFDEDECGFRQSSSDKFDWTRSKGPSPSGGTGPDKDHTSRNGLFYSKLFAPLSNFRSVFTCQRLSCVLKNGLVVKILWNYQYHVLLICVTNYTLA